MSEKEFEKETEKSVENVEKDTKDTVNEVSEKFAPKNVKVQKKMNIILIMLFFGGFGVHRYLMGYSNWWLMPITFGGCGIWTLCDLYRVITDKLPMADGTPLEK